MTMSDKNVQEGMYAPNAELSFKKGAQRNEL